MSFGKAVETFEKATRVVSRISNILAMGVLLIMMLLTVADVSLRYFLNRPILGTLELTEYMMVPIVFLAIPFCGLRDGHAKIDLFVERLPLIAQAIFDSVASFIGLGICALICWQGILESMNMREAQITSNMLNVPIYPFYFVLAIGSLLLFFVIVINIIRSIERIVRSA